MWSRQTDWEINLKNSEIPLVVPSPSTASSQCDMLAEPWLPRLTDLGMNWSQVEVRRLFLPRYTEYLLTLGPSLEAHV